MTTASSDSNAMVEAYQALDVDCDFGGGGSYPPDEDGAEEHIPGRGSGRLGDEVLSR